MKQPLKLTCGIVDVEEVAAVVYCTEDLNLEHHPVGCIIRKQFDSTPPISKMLRVTLKSGDVRMLTGSDAEDLISALEK